MKAIICELCGSNDIVKMKGMYVCQHCGTKYTVEEAQKLIGTVKLDRSDEHAKYIKIMDNAYDGGDFSTAVKYGSLAMEIDPQDYNTYIQLTQAKCADLLGKSGSFESMREIAITLGSGFSTSIAMIKDCNDGAFQDISFIKSVIDTFSYHIETYAGLVDNRITNFINEYGEKDKKSILKDYSPFLEWFNTCYEGMEETLNKNYGSGNELTNHAYGKWLEFISTHGKYFTKVDADKLVRRIKKASRPKKGFFGLF